MKVALDISPLKSGHRVRGIGSYVNNLSNEYKRGQWGIEFEFFESPATPPPADVIHYPYFDLFFKTLPSGVSGREVVTIHDVIPLVFPKRFPAGIRGRINLFFQKKSLKKVDAVICDSHTSKVDIAAKLSYPKEKIHVVYLSAGEKFKKIENQKSLVKIVTKYKLPKKYVLYVGDVNWNKNIPNLLKAVKIAKIALVMVGQAPSDHNLPQTKEINELIKNLGIEKNVLRIGFVNEDDLVCIYNLAHLTASPSLYEGFGLPVLESMACGTPVVCSNIASLAEITGGIASYCDPQDPADMANKIVKVAGLSENGRSDLSEKLQRHASKFSWAKVAKETIEVYKSLI